MKKSLVYTLSLLGLLFSSCEKGASVNTEMQRYFCDAEQVVTTDGGETVFQDGDAIFRGGQLQTDEFAFEGNYSIKLDSANHYGLSILLTEIKKGEYFQASVWQKETDEPGALICKVDGKYTFNFNSIENGFYARQNGWFKHVLQFRAIEDLDSVTFFVFVGGHKQTSYYDNLEIIRSPQRPQEKVGGDLLVLELPDSSLKKLNKNIGKAAKKEIIRNKYKDYVAGTIWEGDEAIPVELRLKGDWTDHLLSGNPSYRIKTESGTAYKGLRSFSIQHPKTRNYMHEWFVHQLCESEDLLSTHYTFLELERNGEYQGVYALEEHFDKQLLESRNRREGPILKMDETGFWKLAIYARKHQLDRIPAPYYESSLTTVFKESRTLKSPNLRGQFENGMLLLDAFKNSYERPELLFDLERIASYYALMDLGNVHHSLAWHNRRFYYNPVTTKLEHVGFDMIPMVLPLNSTLAVREFKKKTEELSPEDGLNHMLFKNRTFRKLYTQKLEAYSAEAYLDSIFDIYETEIVRLEEMMQQELPDYAFQKDLYYQKAELIRNELKTLDKNWDAFMAEDTPFNLMQNQAGKYDLENQPYLLEDIAVNGYRSKLDSGRYLVEFENYHFDSVTLTGYSVKANKDSLLPFDREIKLSGFKGGDDADFESIILDHKPSRFYFVGHNLKQDTARKKYIKWAKPKGEHPRIALFDGFETNSPYYQIRDNQLTLKKGDYSIEELIYIPSDYEVTIEAGTSIDFVNGAGLILNASTRFNGTAEAPIRFISSDSSARGITILQADTVLVNYLEVENFNTLNVDGWVLTGAFSVYEAEVIIDQLKIHNNQCEDGLNIIRSHFDIQNCSISQTFSDGFDADFCTGRFRYSSFENTGNDCIDFSGSQVQVSDIKIVNSGDKGVSAGERSQLIVENIHIEGAITAFASKDDSDLEVKHATVDGVEVGVAVFQKKPEYSPGRMILEDVTYTNVQQLGLLERKSSVVYKGKTYFGVEKLDIDQLYARFEKK